MILKCILDDLFQFFFLLDINLCPMGSITLYGTRAFFKWETFCVGDCLQVNVYNTQLCERDSHITIDDLNCNTFSPFMRNCVLHGSPLE